MDRRQPTVEDIVSHFEVGSQTYVQFLILLTLQNRGNTHLSEADIATHIQDRRIQSTELRSALEALVSYGHVKSDDEGGFFLSQAALKEINRIITSESE